MAASRRSIVAVLRQGRDRWVVRRYSLYGGSAADRHGGVVGWAKARCSAYPRGQNRVRHSPSKTGVTPSLPTRRRYRKRFCPPYRCPDRVQRNLGAPRVYSVFAGWKSARAANSILPSPLWGGSARSAGVGVVRRSTDGPPPPTPPHQRAGSTPSTRR